MLGHAVTDLQVIPPNESAYVNRAYCSAECVTTVRGYLYIYHILA